MLDLWQVLSFCIGLAIVLFALYAIGITRGRQLSQKTWVVIWLVFSVALATFVVGVFVLQSSLISTAVGGAVGYIVAVAVHVADHTLEELKKETS